MSVPSEVLSGEGQALANEVETSSSTVKGAADRILSLMDGKPSSEEPEDPESPEIEDATHPVQEAETDEQEVEAEAKDESDDESEEPTDTESETVTDFSDIAEHLGVEAEYLESLNVPVKINGMTQKATVKELIANYQKGESANLKLQEVAEQRKQLDTERTTIGEQLTQEWGRIESLSSELENMLAESEPQNLEQLRQEDPAEYAAVIAERGEKQRKANQIRQQLQQEKVQKFNENYARIIDSERQKLSSSLPEWSDPEVAQKEMSELRSYFKDQGFSDTEIDGKVENGVVVSAGIVDHRAIVLARKAMLYDTAQKTSKPKKEKLKTLPKIGTGKKVSKEEVNDQKRKEVRGRVRKTGRLEDAALAIKQLMEN